MASELKELYTYNFSEEDYLLIEYEFGGEYGFSPDEALAFLLIKGVVFINDFWWKTDYTEEQKKNFSINVNCSDIFAWGASDAEDLVFEELEDLFQHYKKDPIWGSAIWCIKKRNKKPQEPVFNKIKEAGIWDIEEICKDMK